MGDDRAIVQVSGRLSSDDIELVRRIDAGVRTQTLLVVTARDQSALHGLLHRLHNLGLSLVSLQHAQDSADVFEIVIDGPVGDLAASTLADHIDIVSISSRFSLSGAGAVDQVLTVVQSAGAALQFAATPAWHRSSSVTDQPHPASPNR